MTGMSEAAVISGSSTHATLSARDAGILDFERSWWQAGGTKEQEIKQRFNLTPARYYQVLNALLDDPAALAHDPLLVKRLRRLRESRQKARSAHRLRSLR